MSRFKLWFLTMLLCAAFTVTLMIVAFPLAIVPVGFAVLYLPGLALSLMLAWAMADIRFSRPLIMWATSVFYFTGLAIVGGSLMAGVTAVVLTLVVYTVHKRTNRARRQPAATKDDESIRYVIPGGVSFSYSPTEHAARQVH